MKVYTAIFLWVLMAAVVCTSGCSSSKNYDRAYRRAWKKIVNSQAWYDALNLHPTELADQSADFLPITTGPGTGPVVATGIEGVDQEFLTKFQSLVLRAYFRTIAEAEKADDQIYQSYRRLYEKRHDADNRKSADFQQALQLAKNRYQAHRKMLEGLKSWKAFNEYGSDDLDFFLREQLPQAYSMSRQGRSDEYILRYLVYGLADLYHFEENGEQ